MGGVEYCTKEQYIGARLALISDWLASAVGGLSPKPADREHHRNHEGHQFKRKVTRAELARLDVLNEFSEESHSVKEYGLRHDDGHCRIRVTDDTARRHGKQIL